VILVVLRTSPSEYQDATGFPLARGISRGVDETGGRGDETSICTESRLPPLRTLDRSLASLPCRDFDALARRRVLGFLAPEVACEHALRQRACRPSWPRAPLQSPPFAPAGKPASSRGVGMHQTVTRLAPALRPSTDTSAARPLPVTGATIGLEATSLEVPFRPRGFSPPRRFSPRDGSQVCCTLQPALGFAAFRIVKSVSQLLEHSPQALPPLEGHLHPTAVTRSPAPVPPWRSSSTLTRPHRFRWTG